MVVPLRKKTLIQGILYSCHLRYLSTKNYRSFARTLHASMTRHFGGMNNQQGGELGPAGLRKFSFGNDREAIINVFLPSTCGKIIRTMKKGHSERAGCSRIGEDVFRHLHVFPKGQQDPYIVRETVAAHLNSRLRTPPPSPGIPARPPACTGAMFSSFGFENYFLYTAGSTCAARGRRKMRRLDEERCDIRPVLYRIGLSMYAWNGMEWKGTECSISACDFCHVDRDVYRRTCTYMRGEDFLVYRIIRG